MSRSVEIVFNDTLAHPGEPEVQIEAVGFQGKACEAETKAYEQALGVVAERKLKPEHRQQARQQQRS